MTKIRIYGEEVQLMKSTYKNNGALYVGMLDDEGEFYGDITVNLPNSGTLPSDCAFIDTNNLPNISGILAHYRLGNLTGQMARSGFCVYPVFRFNCLADVDEYI